MAVSENKLGLLALRIPGLPLYQGVQFIVQSEPHLQTWSHTIYNTDEFFSGKQSGG